MKQFTSYYQKIGALGEQIAVDYLISKGFQVIDRNYTKKVGEIDVVATKDNIIHFIEVKTLIKYGDYYNPFENITYYKIMRIKRTVLWYLAEKRVSHETRYALDAIAIEINKGDKHARLQVLWNITENLRN